jgi:hypothetical protein
METVRKPNVGQFKPGNPGGPGRQLGSRNRLSEVALRALGDDFAVHGTAVIEKVRTEEPGLYLRIVCSLLPRQLQVERLPLSDISDDELAELHEHLKALRAKTVQRIKQLEHARPAADPVTSE